MIKPMRKLTAASLSTLMLWGGAASAHGAWVAERHGQLYVVYGHGATDDPYDPAKVTLLQSCDLALQCADIERKPSTDFVAMEKLQQPLVRLEFDNGYWSRDAKGEWVNLPKDQVPGATEAGHYVKTSTHVVSALAGVPGVFGKGLEIRPLQNPMALHKGDRLSVEVLMDGKPAEGAELTMDYLGGDHHDAPVKTGPDGKAEVILASSGLNVILASYTTGPDDPAKADKTGHAATLSFALPHGEE